MKGCALGFPSVQEIFGAQIAKLRVGMGLEASPWTATSRCLEPEYGFSGDFSFAVLDVKFAGRVYQMAREAMQACIMVGASLLQWDRSPSATVQKWLVNAGRACRQQACPLMTGSTARRLLAMRPMTCVQLNE